MGSEGKTVILGLKEWLSFISESQWRLLELRRLLPPEHWLLFWTVHYRSERQALWGAFSGLLSNAKAHRDLWCQTLQLQPELSTSTFQAQYPRNADSSNPK